MLQEQILSLLKSLSKNLSISMLLITHDLPAAETYADRIARLSAGKIEEIRESRATLGFWADGQRKRKQGYFLEGDIDLNSSTATGPLVRRETAGDGCPSFAVKGRFAPG